MLPSIMASHPGPEAAKQPQTTTLPPPCLTVGIVRPGSIDPMTAVVQRVKGFAYYSLSFSQHNKNIKMEHFLLYILSRYFI